jgi:hypothetical protein
MRPRTTVGRRWVALASVGVGLAAVARARYSRWGATGEEVNLRLPGDELLAHAEVTSTRAITIHAAALDVWPWLVQLGQGRGGFYSYDWLENLVGADIHNADAIVPRWQHLEAGDQVMLAANVPLTVAVVEPGRALVLRGGVPMGVVAAPYDFTWAFVVRDAPGGSTRLVVRERCCYTRWWAALIVEPAGLLSSLMSPRMMRGIRQRAERPSRPAPDRGSDPPA